MSSTKGMDRRGRIRLRIRKKIKGSPARPRLSVFRSNKDIYCQVIDDRAGHTLASADSRAVASGTGVEKAHAVGMALAAKALAAGVSAVVFDRSGYLYHGRVKALADGAREGGLQF